MYALAPDCSTRAVLRHPCLTMSVPLPQVYRVWRRVQAGIWPQGLHCGVGSSGCAAPAEGGCHALLILSILQLLPNSTFESAKQHITEADYGICCAPQDNAGNYDKGVLAEILEPIMGKVKHLQSLYRRRHCDGHRTAWL